MAPPRMGPPRLTVVGGQGSVGPEGEQTTPDGEAATPANDALPVGADGDEGRQADDAGMGSHGEAETSLSPVHDLIQSIETEATGVAQHEPETTENGDGDEKRGPDTADAATQAEATPAALSPSEHERVRVIEAVIFATSEPVDAARLGEYLKPGERLDAILAELVAIYATRGVNLVQVAGKWAFRTAADLSWALERHAKQERRLSRAALETLAIVAYHQPVTRAEIEEVRGVTISKGTLDVLMEAGFVRPRGRRRAPGKPVTYGTTEQFLAHFSLGGVSELPGLADLKAAGLLDSNLPPDFKMPSPTDVAALMPDELPLEAGGDGDEPLQTELDLDAPDPGDDEDGDASRGGHDPDLESDEAGESDDAGPGDLDDELDDGPPTGRR